MFLFCGNKPDRVKVLLYEDLSADFCGDLVTVMWANEIFDLEQPDTFYEVVDREGDEKINPENGNV